MNIDARLDTNAQGWRPEVGEKLVGIILEVSEGESEYGRYPLLIVDSTGDYIAVHAFHTVLKNELSRLRPQPGDTIGIKYLGKPPGKSYESYRVALDRKNSTAAGADWDAHAAAAQAELGTDGQAPVPTASSTPVDDDGDEPF